MLDDDDDDVECVEEYRLTPREMAEKEVRQYRSMAKMNMASNPLIFWQENQFLLPTLARIAEKFAVAQATSVASERVFSTAGDIVTAERACLDHTSVDSLIFLKKNLDGPPIG